MQGGIEVAVTLFSNNALVVVSETGTLGSIATVRGSAGVGGVDCRWVSGQHGERLEVLARQISERVIHTNGYAGELVLTLGLRPASLNEVELLRSVVACVAGLKIWS